MSRPYRFASASLVALVAALAGGVANSVAEEPTVEPIELEFEAVEAPGLKDLRRTGQYPPPTFSTPGGLPPEILRVQQELGGSVVNQFPSLQPGEPLPQYKAAPPSNARQLVEALRDAAWTMDSWANRLEKLEAYQQADALRAHAQRLRLEARGLAPPSPGESAAPNTPDLAPQIEITPNPVEPSPTELR